MAWKSDELLDRWKDRTGSPLLMRVGAAGFVWTMLGAIAFDWWLPFFVPFGFWLLTAVPFAQKVLWRSRFSILVDFYIRPITTFRFTLWLAYWPSSKDRTAEKVAGYLAGGGFVAVFVSIFARTP